MSKQEQIEQTIYQLLELLGEDPNREGLLDPDFITLFFHDPVQSLDRIGFFKYFFIFYLCCML
ncbi:hypothetical protein Q7W24_11535, partial [Streptococcus suis]|nr:hypothetical protein [Streptococcus suis]